VPAIALVLKIVSGMVLALRYLPDAGQAHLITSKLLGEGGWWVALNFQYEKSYQGECK
jgi:quinol-cytochrome oxidoreductase complex cytochrome b subunit